MGSVSDQAWCAFPNSTGKEHVKVESVSDQAWCAFPNLMGVR